MENAQSNVVQMAAAEREVPKFMLRINAITGTETAKECTTLWTGRQVGKQPRKDLQLSQELPKLTGTLHS